MPTDELFGNYNFLLEISSITGDSRILVAGFKSLSGMDSETEIVEFKDNGDKIVRKKPGRTRYANIVLERGYTRHDSELLEWWRSGTLRQGSIVILDRDGETEIGRYSFTNGKVVTHGGPATGLAIERLEIAVETIRRGEGPLSGPSLGPNVLVQPAPSVNIGAIAFVNDAPSGYVEEETGSMGDDLDLKESTQSRSDR